jgi:2-desacetyl-2-hydroxyethyl bacteriochlorophyllide A dehydrogenase
MQAATLVEPGRFALGEVEPPQPGPGQVLLAVQGCGVCGSDMGPWRGVAGISYPLPPGAPGHEVFGTVAALGPGVEDGLVDGALAVGDAVTALAFHGYSAFDVMDASAVVRLPPELAGRPVLGEPLACAVNVMKRAGIREGDVVVLVGAGFLGALILQLARRARPGRLVAVSRRPSARELALAAGADEALGYDDDVDGRIAALTGGRLADVVIEATGRQGPLDLAARLVRVRGRLVVAGYHQDGPRTVDMQLWNWRGLDVVNAHERDPEVYRRGMEEGVALAAAGEIDLAPLLTHRFPLADINRAFATAAARPEGFLKAVVTTP